MVLDFLQYYQVRDLRSDVAPLQDHIQGYCTANFPSRPALRDVRQPLRPVPSQEPIFRGRSKIVGRSGTLSFGAN